MGDEGLAPGKAAGSHRKVLLGDKIDLHFKNTPSYFIELHLITAVSAAQLLGWAENFSISVISGNDAGCGPFAFLPGGSNGWLMSNH